MINNKLKKMLLYFGSVVLLIYYGIVMYLAVSPNVSEEYKDYYITHTAEQYIK